MMPIARAQVPQPRLCALRKGRMLAPRWYPARFHFPFHLRLIFAPCG